MRFLIAETATIAHESQTVVRVMSQTLESAPATGTTPLDPAVRLRLVEMSAFVLSAAMLAGSIFLSLGMDLIACPLCIIERTFVMGVVAVLAVSWLTPGLRGTGLGCRLALPLALAGLATVAFHAFLEMSEAMVCPWGVLALGTAPQQSLATYVLLTLVLAYGAWMGMGKQAAAETGGWAAVILVLGLLLAVASIKAAPPPAPPADKTLEQLQMDKANLTLKGCRPVKK
jgi:disulfide bond formation protein DsbB